MNQSQYKKYYSEYSFREKLKKYAKSAGTQVVYAALLLYFLMKDGQTPLKIKLMIAGALGYFILPADAIPDITPLLGFSDDLGVLIFVLSQIRGNITPEIREQARTQLLSWFNQIDEAEIEKLDNKIF
ncbi:YkvA family protein [Gaoshiqia sp. Z1-71]|uniref:YkvA family protein n=1 Tax=Gaoshiqia hydrogeniformans TaxID=3290090 RepID=UPI003BF8F933